MRGVGGILVNVTKCDMGGGRGQISAYRANVFCARPLDPAAEQFSSVTGVGHRVIVVVCGKHVDGPIQTLSVDSLASVYVCTL